MGLITDIQQSIVDNATPLTPTLRKAKILAYRLDNIEFKTWVEYELGSYPTENDFDTMLKLLPEYRKEGVATLYGDFNNGYSMLQNYPFSVSGGPSYLHISAFPDGIPSLEKLVSDSENGQLHQSVNANLVNSLLPKQPYKCIRAWKPISIFNIISIIEAVRDRLLTFTLELQNVYPDLDDDVLNKQIVSDEKLTQLFQITVQEGGNMSMFDQRGQKVSGNQYNAARDINFSGVQNQTSYIEELEKLQDDLSNAVKAGELDESAATDADYHLKKAVQEAKKSQPDKTSIKTHLENLSGVITGVASLGAMVITVTQAIQALQTVFH